jgi:CO/xanthine dehydrogenase FAD-binding subunit
VPATITLDRRGRCIAARLVYCNADDRPFDATDAAAALIGKRLNPPTIGAAAEGATPAVGRAAAFTPARRSSVNLAGTFTRRAALQANDRAMK